MSFCFNVQQEVLEAVCPCEWNTPRKRLCVVLVTEESSAYDPHRDTFRSYAQKSPYSTDRVRFAYIYHGKQTEFVSSLIPGTVYFNSMLYYLDLLFIFIPFFYTFLIFGPCIIAAVENVPISTG